MIAQGRSSLGLSARLTPASYLEASEAPGTTFPKSQAQQKPWQGGAKEWHPHPELGELGAKEVEEIGEKSGHER